MLKKVLVSVLVLLLGVLSYFALRTPVMNALHDGSMEVVLVDEEGKTVDTRTIWFDEGDKMFDVLKEEFKLVEDEDYIDYGDFGVFITSIGELQSDDDYWLELFVDDKSSTVSISFIELKDGLTIKFVMTEISW